MSNIRDAAMAAFNKNPIEFEKHWTPIVKEKVQTHINDIQRHEAAKFFGGRVATQGNDNE